MKNLFLLFIGLCLTACAVDEPTLTIQPTEINMSEISVGQKSYFVKYSSNCNNYSHDFELIGDTLVMEVVEQNDSLFFQEHLTPGSTFYIQFNDTDTIKQFVDVKADYLIIPERGNSSLFYFYGNDTLRIKYNYTATLKQNSCRMMIDDNVFVGEEIGLIRSFKVGSYSFFNKTAVSCVPGWMDMEAYLVYDKNNLYASQTMINDFVNGWIKL